MASYRQVSQAPFQPCKHMLNDYAYVGGFRLSIAYSGYLKYLRNFFQMLLKVNLQYIKFYLLYMLDSLCGCVKKADSCYTGSLCRVHSPRF